MERICEPELMDDALQAQAYAEADFSESDQAMVEWIVDLFGDGPGATGLGARIVDLGCGPGNITFRLASACPGAAVLGIDGAGRMLAIAEARRQADPRWLAAVSFRLAVLPSAELEQAPLAAAFSAVVSNSLLHHLHDPQVFWQAVRQMAAPGAAVYVQDLRRPPTPEAVEALVAAEMVGAPEVLRSDYRNSLYAAFTPQEVEMQLRVAGIGCLEARERGERYLEVWGRLV